MKKIIKKLNTDLEGVSCIIPAYNEGERIGKVISILEKHPLVNEVIVVNDGSTDNTLKVIKKFKNIKIISYKNNRGKSFAIYSGIKKSRYASLMLIDSDLLGLTSIDITNLITPIIEKKSDISISLRGNTPMFWKMIGLDFISGERVFPKNLINNPEEILLLPGFGLEVFINKKILNNTIINNNTNTKKLKIQVVKWPNVQSPFPQSKFGFFKGTKRLFGMIKQIINTVGFFGVIIQIILMLKLKN